MGAATAIAAPMGMPMGAAAAVAAPIGTCAATLRANSIPTTKVARGYPLRSSFHADAVLERLHADAELELRSSGHACKRERGGVWDEVG
jgi:hypothetical protein